MKRIKKRYIVKNKARLFLFLLAVIMVLSIAAAAYVTASDIPGNYTKVCVQSDDTLWSIAKRYAGNGQDIRDVVAEIIAVNALSDSAYIHPGDVLLVPCK